MIRRSSAGRFASAQPRDSHFVLQIVRDVASAAVAADETRDPRSVTHNEFKGAAKTPELVERYGHIPTPNAFCAGFPDRNGDPIRWRALLELAFEEDRSEESIRREHTARLRAEADPDLTEDHIYFALTYVVRAEETRTGATIRVLGAARYDETRSRLIANDRRRKTPHELERMVPTRSQIERVAGGWWRAVEIAGLEVPSATTPSGRRGIPLVDAVLRYYMASGGFLPSCGQAQDFATAFRFAMQRSVGQWHNVLTEARAEIEQRGLPAPEPYDPRTNPPVEPPSGYEPDPDDPIYQEKEYWENKPLVLQFVIEYLDWLGPRPSSATLWRQFRAEKNAAGVPLPDATTLRTRYGSLAALVREASLPGALERAIAEYDREPTPEELAERQRREIERVAVTPQAQELLAFICEQGEIGPKQMGETLGWSRTKVVIWCAALRGAGLISATHENPNHKRVRYFPIAEGQTEVELREVRARREVELRADREAAPELVRLLHERRYLPPQTITTELGWGRDKLRDVLEDLLGARLVAATHSGPNRSIHYFAVEPNMSDEEVEHLRAQIVEQAEVETQQARELLALLRGHEALMPKEIRELLNWAPEKVEYWLKPLLRHRLIARTHTSSKSRYGRYFAIDPDVGEEQLGELRAYWHRQPPQGADDARRLHAFLLDHADGVRPNSIKEAFGWGGTKTTEQLKLLERAGLAERTGGSTSLARWEGRRSSPPPGGWTTESGTPFTAAR